MRNSNNRIPFGVPFSPSGTRFKTVYESQFNGNRISLVATGTLDTQAEIEALAPFSDFNYMLHRLKVGDRSVLSSRSPMFGDFSGLSHNPIDVINIVSSAERKFSTLPEEVRKQCNNDYRIWLASVVFGSNAGNSAPDPAPDTAPDSDKS